VGRSVHALKQFLCCKPSNILLKELHQVYTVSTGNNATDSRGNVKLLLGC